MSFRIQFKLYRSVFFFKSEVKTNLLPCTHLKLWQFKNGAYSIRCFRCRKLNNSSLCSAENCECCWLFLSCFFFFFSFFFSYVSIWYLISTQNLNPGICGSLSTCIDMSCHRRIIARELKKGRRWRENAILRYTSAFLQSF